MIEKKSIFEMSNIELTKELSFTNNKRNEIRRLLYKYVSPHTDLSLSNLSDKKLIQLVEETLEKEKLDAQQGKSSNGTIRRDGFD